MRLTREERKAIFRGKLTRLQRAEKPDQEAGTKIVVSSTKGGRQIVDRQTGETIEVPRQPRLWIVIKGWHLKAGQTEWETAVEIVDLREQNRVLANGIGGVPREPGLKTRWGTRVVHAEGKVEVRPKNVPTKDEQHENWTPETERGYGGSDELERCDFDGSLVPSSGVDDATIANFLAPEEQGGHGIADKNIGARLLQRERERKMRSEMKLAGEWRRAIRRKARAAASEPVDDGTTDGAERAVEAVV